jgi:hypothetical protein
MAQFLKSDLVETIIAAQGNRATTVTFMKADGTVTTRNGLPKVHVRRVGGDKGAKQAQVLRDNGLLFFDYPQKDRADGKRGFSFKKDRVIAIAADGANITAHE